MCVPWQRAGGAEQRTVSAGQVCESRGSMLAYRGHGHLARTNVRAARDIMCADPEARAEGSIDRALT